MSGIEQQIAQWRVELAQSQSLTPSDLDELESHLREEIANFQPMGLSQPEAFLLARHRLGEPHRLANEFSKVNGNPRRLERLTWIVLGACLYMVGALLAGSVSQWGIVVAAQLGLRGYGLGVVALAAQAAALIGLIGWMGITFSRSAGNGSGVPSAWLSGYRLVLLLMAFAGVNVALVAAQGLPRLMTIRQLGVTDFGQIAFIAHYANTVWWVLGPLVLAGMAITLRARGRRWRGAGTACPSE